jgi:hypothetical protein
MCQHCGDEDAVHPNRYEALMPNPSAFLGYIPFFLNVKDARPAKEQFNSKYIGGWRPFEGYKVLAGRVLKYPDDPPLRPAVKIWFRKELIIVYPSAWVMIEQPDGSQEIAHMD